MKKRLGSNAAGVADLYYRFKEPETPNDKVVVLRSGMILKGRYLGQQVRGEFTDFMFEREDGKTFSLSKTKGLADALDGAEKGLLVEIVYGGKKKLPGGKSFHVIDVYDLSEDEASETDPL